MSFKIDKKTIKFNVSIIIVQVFNLRFMDDTFWIKKIPTKT